MTHQQTKSSNPLRVAFDGYWKTIHPGLQHTLVCDLVLSNQFDALVGINDSGVISPLGAKSWKVSEDSRTFTFKIDTSKQYSDGIHLSSSDYKASWEDALKLEPKSMNSSLLDVLYKLEGYGDFSSTDTISGIETPNLETLVLRFRSPFRMALEHLSGNRFAAYRELNHQFLGTGKYSIEEDAENHQLKLTANPFCTEKPAVENILVSTVLMPDLLESLENKKIDVLASGSGADLSENIFNDKRYTILSGQDAYHKIIYINGLQGHIFHDPELRLAFQYLTTEILNDNPRLLGTPQFTNIDSQVFLPLQAGRLDPQEVRSIVAQGKPFVQKLILATQRTPLVGNVLESGKWLLEELSKKGIVLSPLSKVISREESLRVIYKSVDHDFILTAFSVVSGDPDGIYHALGKSGAIRSPVVYREGVGHLLEVGRKIIGQEKLHDHYREVARAVLLEVPMVHLGFSKAVAVLRNDRATVDNHGLRRNEGHLDIFGLK